MPCRSYDDASPEELARSENNSLRIENVRLKSENQELEAALCAVFTELEKDNVLDDMIAVASKNGDIDLAGIWKKHKKDDLDRLKKDLEKYSHHELDMIRLMLNNLPKK